MGRGIFLSHFATSRGWKEFTFALSFIFLCLFLLFFNFFISLELFLLLPAADDFEKQCLLYFLPSDWPVAEISSQQLNHFPPSYFKALTHAFLACAPGI